MTDVPKVLSGPSPASSLAWLEPGTGGSADNETGSQHAFALQDSMCRRSCQMLTQSSQMNSPTIRV